MVSKIKLPSKVEMKEPLIPPLGPPYFPDSSTAAENYWRHKLVDELICSCRELMPSTLACHTLKLSRDYCKKDPTPQGKQVAKRHLFFSFNRPETFSNSI